MNLPRLFLSKHCFLCRSQNYWIILSTLQDRYYCVANDDMTAISHRLHGWPAASGLDGLLSTPAINQDDLIGTLAASKIITNDPAEGKAFVESPNLVRPSRCGFPAVSVSLIIIFRCLFRFLTSCGIADWRLRTKPLSKALPTVKSGRLEHGMNAVDRDPGDASLLVAAFKALRPLYPRPYLCLFESLALHEFLSRCRIPSQLVFGVIAEPFQAHCWLQHGALVLNDELDRVSLFTAIFST